MVDGDTFRQVTGHFATGVTVVTVNADGTDHGMTVNSFASVSLEPPYVLFNADVDTNTHDLVADAEHYAVNILTRDQEALSDRFAGAHHDLDEPFEDIPTTRKATGAPIFEESLGYIDCSLEAGYDGGDHTIYLGRVEEMDLLESGADPLTFYQGQYGTIE